MEIPPGTISGESMAETRRLYPFLTAITENTTDGIFLKDLQGRYAMVNSAVARFVGKSADEIMGKTDEALFDPVSAARIAARDREIMRSGRVGTFEETVTSVGGTRIHQVTLGPVRDGEGNVAGLFGIARDVTDRKRAEEALKQANVILSSALESTADGLLVVNLAGTIIRYNKKFLELWDIPAEVAASGDDNLALSYALRQLVDPDTFIRKVRELYSDPAAESFDVIDLKDGRTFERYSTPMKMDGESMGRVWSFRDVTIRKRVEEALRSSEEHYRQVVENANDGIVVVKDGAIVFANPRVSEFTEVAPENTIGRNMLSFVHPEDHGMVVEYHTKRMRREPVLPTYEFRAVSKSGNIAWVENSAVPITWKGSPATLGFLRDISQQKALESQLLHSRKMEAIGTLAGGIAHDFNNLLQVILGFAHLTSRDLPEEGTLRPYVGHIETAASRAADLVHRLLTFSRTDRPEMKKHDLNEDVVRTVELLERVIPKMIRIEIRLEPSLRPIMGDEAQIEQVIMNLGVNGRDAMPNGGSLEVATRNMEIGPTVRTVFPEAPPGLYVLLSVRDTGTGMDPKTIGRIFDPFFTTKGVGAGTGLGLSMVYGVVRAHGGWIRCESEPDRGTCFEILLPALDEPVDLPEKEAPAEASKVRGTETILFVDDDELVGNVGQLSLEELGYSVIRAQSGEEALSIFRAREKEIALVVLDIGMPGMGGRKCLTELRKMSPEAKILVVSGYMDEAGAGGVLEDGARGFLGKPYNSSQLARFVRDIIDQK